MYDSVLWPGFQSRTWSNLQLREGTSYKYAISPSRLAVPFLVLRLKDDGLFKEAAKYVAAPMRARSGIKTCRSLGNQVASNLLQVSHLASSWRTRAEAWELSPSADATKS
jgi:hypothetical protein